jgi:hypothetical protein
MPSILQATCLSPKKSLRSQLFSSFGLAAFLSLFLVVFSSSLAIHRSGDDVKRYSEQLIRKQVEKSLLRSSELVAEKYSSRIASIESTLQLLVEAVRDRIVGYPSMPGWEDGMYVPFQDYYYLDEIRLKNSSSRQQNRYPLSQPPAPFDWKIRKEKMSLYTDSRINAFKDILYSTKSASYHMPGICDESSATAVALGCTEEQNNVTSGGIFPSSTHEGLYKATGDLSVFMKPLYEANRELLKLQIIFFNEGAGTTLQYPAGPIAPLVPTYTSTGCDWMAQMKNPYTGSPFATVGEVSKCRYEGIEVESRFYNPMETGIPEYILKNGKSPAKTPTDEGHGSTRVAWQGPLLASDNKTAILRAGKAVYDRL